MSSNENNLTAGYKIVSMVLLVAFLLPWVDAMGIITFSGFSLPGVVRNLGQMASAFSDDGTGLPAWALLVNLIYLIPIINGIIIGKKERKVWFELGSSIFILVAFAIGIFRAISVDIDVSELFTYFGIGLYATLAAAVAQLVFAIIKDNK